MPAEWKDLLIRISEIKDCSHDEDDLTQEKIVELDEKFETVTEEMVIAFYT